jgi:hypothetical protein
MSEVGFRVSTEKLAIGIQPPSRRNAEAGVSRRIVEYRRSEKIYSQGDPAASVMYVQKGGINFPL